MGTAAAAHLSQLGLQRNKVLLGLASLAGARRHFTRQLVAQIVLPALSAIQSSKVPHNLGAEVGEQRVLVRGLGRPLGKLLLQQHVLGTVLLALLLAAQALRAQPLNQLALQQRQSKEGNGDHMDYSEMIA